MTKKPTIKFIKDGFEIKNGKIIGSINAKPSGKEVEIMTCRGCGSQAEACYCGCICVEGGVEIHRKPSGKEEETTIVGEGSKAILDSIENKEFDSVNFFKKAMDRAYEFGTRDEKERIKEEVEKLPTHKEIVDTGDTDELDVKNLRTVEFIRKQDILNLLK